MRYDRKRKEAKGWQKDRVVRCRRGRFAGALVSSRGACRAGDHAGDLVLCVQEMFKSSVDIWKSGVGAYWLCGIGGQRFECAGAHRACGGVCVVCRV